MIETERLILRGWREEDTTPFAAMNADPAVMRYLSPVPADPRRDAVETIARQQAIESRDGCCFWAIERREDSAFLGFCGLRAGGHAGTPVGDELEIGWRLASPHWGFGYAREAAMASIDWGWRNTARPRIAAWTVPANIASWGLMRRLGMVRRPELDFGHPRLAPEDPLHVHIVYTIERPDAG